ncbi:hypothetical protein BOX15_Mlig015622g2, partial [Macrostomum lignano]
MSVPLQLPPPEPFDTQKEPHNLSARWAEWANRFKCFVTASGITDASQQREILLYVGGKQVAEAYAELTRPGKTLEELLDALKEYFKSRHNPVFVRYEFRHCTQQPGEAINAWVQRLFKAAEGCEFETQRDLIIRDQIVAGCQSDQLRRRLLQTPNIQLKEALQQARAFEAADLQSAVIEARKSESVNAMRRIEKPDRPERTRTKCIRCGESGHRTCEAARGKTCRNCNKVGHLAKACLSKPASSRKVHAIAEEQPSDQQQRDSDSSCEVFCLTPQRKRLPLVKADINGHATDLLIDSGASCNLMDSKTFKAIGGTADDLRESKQRVFPFGSSEPLTTLGKATLRTAVYDVSASISYIIVKETGTTIVGRETSEKLGILRIGPSNPSVCHLKDSGELHEPLSAALAAAATEADDQAMPQHERLSNIIKTFRQRFVGIGCVKDVEVGIHLQDGAVPVCHPPSRIPVHLREAAQRELDDQLQAGIIEKVTGPSEWVARIVVVPKSQPGQVRITQDLRDVNKFVVPEKQPIPTFEEVTDEMAGARYFTELDINKAFHQIRVREDSRHLLTFSTPKGLMRLTRLCMGFTSASEILQRVMTSVLGGLPGVRWVHDDIIIYASSIIEHNQRLAATLQRLEEHNITLNPAKCKFAVKEAKFLAMRLSEKGIQPTDEKVSAVKAFRAPKNASEVRSFLGLVAFVSRFIPALSDMAKPPRDLTRKDAPWSWGAAEETAFSAIKNSISARSTLAFFDKRRPTEVIVDASPTGLGAILSQQQPDGSLRPIAYASRALSAVETRYSQTEREALAVKFGCLRFRHYLSGSSGFRVVTDHKPLVHLFKPGSHPPPRIERMALSIQDLVFETMYRPGSTNPSDVLSRQIFPASAVSSAGATKDNHYINSIAEDSTPKGLALQQLKDATTRDGALQAAISALRGGKWDLREATLRSLHAVKQELSAADGILLRGQRIVVPEALQLTVLRLAHQGHQGAKKTQARLSAKVWWPGMAGQAQRMCNVCLPCQAASHQAEVPAAPLQATPLPPHAWHTLGIDFTGPVQNKHLLVIVDHFSRYPIVISMSAMTAEAVTKQLRKLFS